MYVNKCSKCGAEFETKNPKRVICPSCLYPDRKPLLPEKSSQPIGNDAQPQQQQDRNDSHSGGSRQSGHGQGGYQQGGYQQRRPYQGGDGHQGGGSQGGGFRRPHQGQGGGYGNRQQGGGYGNRQQGGGYGNRQQGGGYGNRQQGGGYGNRQQGGGYGNRPQSGGYGNRQQGGGYGNRPQGGGYGNRPQGGGYGNRPQGSGYGNRPQGGGGFRRPQGGGFRGGQQQRPRRSLLISKEQVAEIEKLYKAMLPLPNPDAHEVIGKDIELEPNKVFFGINLIRQKMNLPKLPYPKRKLAVSPEQLMAIENLYTPLLPLPPIGCHKIIAKQLKVDEWRVHVGIGIIRKQMNLPRWNPDREDAPEEFKNQAQEEAAKEEPASKEE